MPESSIVKGLLRKFQTGLFIYFSLRKDFECTKPQIKPKLTNKTKTTEQKTTTATVFWAQKLLRGGKLAI